MGARIALELLPRGYNVRFTRHIDVKHNPYLKDLDENDRNIIEALNSDTKVLATRFGARVDVAKKAAEGGERVLAMVLHADISADAKNNLKQDRRGAGVFIHPHHPVTSPSYRFNKELQIHYRDAKGGTLGPNVTKGVIPGQAGFGALFTDKTRTGEPTSSCTPEIGLGTRTVTIIDPTKGYGNIPISLVEMGYLSNLSDTYRLRNSQWAMNFARVTADGVDSFFSKEYEQDKKPVAWAPPPVTISGVTATRIPSDPALGAKAIQKMQQQVAADPTQQTEIKSRMVSYCHPAIGQTTGKYAAVVPKAKPKPVPAAKHTELAKRPDTPPTRG